MASQDLKENGRLKGKSGNDDGRAKAKYEYMDLPACFRVPILVLEDGQPSKSLKLKVMVFVFLFERVATSV